VERTLLSAAFDFAFISDLDSLFARREGSSTAASTTVEERRFSAA